MATRLGWTSAESAAESPLMKYLRGLAPVGTLIYIDTEQVARRMGWKNLNTVSGELFMLKAVGVVKYFAEKHSREIAVRVLV